MSTEPDGLDQPLVSPESVPAAEALAGGDGVAAPTAPAAAAEDPTPAAAAEASTATTVADAAAATTVAGAAAAAAGPAVTAVPTPSRRTRAAVLARRLVRWAVAVGLFAAGVAFGWNAYLTNRPAPAVVGDPGVVGQPPPAVVQEFVTAIESGDADAIRAALQQEMFARYTAEVERFGIASVDDVEPLGTFTDGARTATALILHGTTVDRNPFSLNLVVVTQDGLIVRLR